MTNLDQLTLSAEVFPAKICQSRESAPELTGTVAAYGQNTPVLLASWDRKSLSWRTSQTCLVAQATREAAGLAEFSATWPRSGMMRNGIVYRLPTLVSGTFGTEFGLWPTPNATAYKGGRTSPRRGKANPEKNNWQDFCSLVLGQRYPVPETAEQVMGFPTGHTEICPSEMQSPLNSQNLSEG